MKKQEKIKRILYIIGIISLLFGIYLSIFQKEPHFYAFFSVGLFLILLNVYNSISKDKLFEKWKTKQYIIFITTLIIISVILDKIGLSLGYWTYQYNTLFDEIIKYLFEWIIPFIYLMLTLIIGIKVFNKKFNKKISFVFSLIIFVTLVGLFTEYINLFSDSWTIIKMPFTDQKIGEFFIIFQTLGYWIMAIITFMAYKFTDKLK